MLFLFAFSSCSKRGCTDLDAENFEPKAKTDCGCCYFGGKALGWYQKPFYDNLNATGVKSLKYYANDELVGEAAAEIPIYNVQPTTNYNAEYRLFPKGAKNVLVVSLGSFKIKKLEIRVTDQDEKLLWTDSVTFIANKVISIQLK